MYKRQDEIVALTKQKSGLAESSSDVFDLIRSKPEAVEMTISTKQSRLVSRVSSIVRQQQRDTTKSVASLTHRKSGGRWRLKPKDKEEGASGSGHQSVDAAAAQPDDGDGRQSADVPEGTSELAPPTDADEEARKKMVAFAPPDQWDVGSREWMYDTERKWGQDATFRKAVQRLSLIHI